MNANVCFWDGLEGLTGTESIASLFKHYMSLFPYRYASAMRRAGSQKWLDLSRFHSLTDQEILDSLQTGAKTHRAFRCDGNTMFIGFRIPAASRYHDASTIQDIRLALKRIGVTPKHYQIEDDWYLYIYLKNPGRVTELVNQLRYWCILQGLVVGPDTIEILPSDLPIPFPLAGKFYWLNEKCQYLLRRDEVSLEKALAFFLDDARSSAYDVEELQNCLRRTGSFLKTVLEPARDRQPLEKDAQIDMSIPVQDEIEESTAAALVLQLNNAESPVESDALELPPSTEMIDNVISISFDRSTATKAEVSGLEKNVMPPLVELFGSESIELVNAEEIEDDGSRLVVFHDPVNVAPLNYEEKQALAEIGAQLLLFPVQDQAKAPERVETEAAQTGSGTRRRRKERRGQDGGSSGESAD